MVSAEFFDIFGFIVFAVLLWIGISLRKIAKNRAKAIMVISILGLLVDGYIVLTRFILN